MKRIDRESTVTTNRALFIIKFFAVLSIVSAHTGMEYYSSPLFQLIKQRFSASGVIAFLIVAGYYYNGSKYGSFIKMLLNKLKNVGIPWLIFGTIAYLWANVKVETGFSGLQLSELFRYLIGYKTYLYYMPVLMICFILFYRHNNATIIASFVLTLCSLFLTAFDYINVSAIGITNYMNAFNWIGFFAFGLLCKKYNIIEKTIQKYNACKLSRLFVFLIYLAVILCTSLFIETDKAGYFSKTGAALELMSFFVLVGLSSSKAFNNQVCLTVAKCSFFIYLVHTMVLSVLGYISILTRQLSVLQPILVVGIVSLGCYILECLFKNQKTRKTFYLITGIREIK